MFTFGPPCGPSNLEIYSLACLGRSVALVLVRVRPKRKDMLLESAGAAKRKFDSQNRVQGRPRSRRQVENDVCMYSLGDGKQALAGTLGAQVIDLIDKRYRIPGLATEELYKCPLTQSAFLLFRMKSGKAQSGLKHKRSAGKGAIVVMATQSVTGPGCCCSCRCHGHRQGGESSDRVSTGAKMDGSQAYHNPGWC